MGFIIKNTSALVNSKLTDTGRRKLSQGSFNISYFQVGDSEVSYNTLPDTYNQYETMILEPSFNAQNSSGYPQSNKQNVKYPYYVDGLTGNTYGIPFMDSEISPVFNRARMRGFFTGNTTDTNISWSAFTNSDYTINSNYIVQMSSLTGGTVINISYSGCNTDIVRMPAVGDFITIYYNGNINCLCESPAPTPTPTPTMTPTPSYDPCALPLPTPTPSDSSVVPTPTPSPIPSSLDCFLEVQSCYPVLTYKIVDICLNQVTLDRPTPDYSYLNSNCYARTIIYPSTMTEIYDSVTPSRHWNDDVVNYESVCETDAFDVNIWNMNIPWSESPAGLFESTIKGYSYFGSTKYLGTKEYLGYASSSGQTDTGGVYYYNSFGERINVVPEEQKTIAIVHYTNQTIDFFYGEKFAMEEFDPGSGNDTLGFGRNFRVHLPTLMWHKNTECCNGVTFWVDPPGFDEGLSLFTPYYIKSNKNSDMNSPGIRYYYLWDRNPNSQDEGRPNRVGKVFPDSHLIVFDDEEIVASLSYKANRNWTLPAPKVSLVTPNILTQNGSTTGVLTGASEYMYVTYRLSNTDDFTNSLHCNYYQKIQGPDIDCKPTLSSQDVSVRFGGEFNCLNYQLESHMIGTTTTTTTTTTTLCPTACDLTQGFYANKFEIICQKVTGDIRPDSSEWKIIDFTSQLSGTTINGYLTHSGITGTTFVITDDIYEDADTYDLTDYISLPTIGSSSSLLNFGDEYYFYGNVETDIQATIYEMRYKINLGQAEFQATSNPTWDGVKSPYITEIGLYDSDKNLMIISKLQSPVLRQGIQQFLVKFDF